MQEDLINKIYESAFIPENFEKIIVDLKNIAECQKGFVFCTKDGLSLESYVADECSHELVQDLVNGGWIKNNPQAPSLIRLGEPRFFNDGDIFSDDEINIIHKDFYHKFFRSHGVFWGTGSLIRGPSGENIVYSFHRSHEFGPIPSSLVSRLTQLRPHLARAAFISARLKMREAKAMVAALADIGLPAAAITATGKLYVANELFSTLIPSILADFRSRIRFAALEADGKFQAAILQSQVPETGGGSVTFAARPGKEQGVPMIIHMVPIVGNSRDIFSGAAWLLAAVPVSITSPDPMVLEGLFDLTVAESHVARGIAEGRSVEAIANARNTSIETVRSQLKSVMQKTGTGRQSELAALLRGGIDRVGPAEGS